jgi:hypothetical protein
MASSVGAMTQSLVERTRTNDSFLRLMMRADAAITGLAGVAGIPLAGWLASISGTPKAFEYGMDAFFVSYGLVVLGLAALASVRRAGLAVIAANLLFTVATVALVLTDVFPLTTVGVVLTLGSGAYTLVFAELQYQGWKRARG